ncbi:adenylate/guanylate cyclase domain-containing protein [Bradyrhizobium sp.]|uniref:adenylate/guanylate cyclase domain-containing protein n=1 Tax=Bradyrhizobium sp. TaxID=376 RepID=UPI001DD74C0E|nr:adenylate/guanylate cyclase domain-containing protein [Bradyrhizobium sp.]MBI5321760.1 adenylate/guanylate cyclase domain-containing protein [Bradyrhizobium sp.]
MPETRYATSGEISIAYQVVGSGPLDLIMIGGSVSHVEFLHEIKGYTDFLRKLSTFSRVITFDKRGQGLSDRVHGAPSLEDRMDDIRAVMDAVGSKRAALMSFSEGGALSVIFAASYPERVSHLIMFGCCASFAEVFPNPEERIDQRIKHWGTGALLSRAFPSLAGDPEMLERLAKLERLSATPSAHKTMMSLNLAIDVKAILPSVRVPTLVLHRRTDLLVPVDAGRELADLIPNSKYIEYPDGDHGFFTGNVTRTVGDIAEFVTGHREEALDESDRVLATVLFTDIVGSTESAAELGDKTWKGLLDSHDHIARQTIESHRGKLVKSTGDGILATFDGPGRAVRCALAFEAAANKLGLPLRAGLHTGEIELRDRDIGGIAVHAAARVMSVCQPNEVLVSRVVTDLVAGAGLKFSDRGSHVLKGLPGRWDLFAASV